MLRRKVLVWGGCVGLAVAGLVVWMSSPRPARAQDGKKVAETDKKAAKTDASDQRSFEARFWDFLQSAQYQNWAPGPNQGLEPHRGRSPHGSYLKVYVNRAAAANPKSPPHGSIIVKENLGRDKKKLLSLTVMYRVKGYDTDHNDWYWVKYNPNGTVARVSPDVGGKPIAGRVKACIDCHAKSKGADFYFSNDQ